MDSSSDDAGLPARPSLASGQRIGDAERAEAAEALGEHFAAGRLDHSEFDVRLDAAYTARTAADLLPLFADLPAPVPALVRPAPSDTSPAGRGEGRRWRPRAGVPMLPLLVVVGVVFAVTQGVFPFFLFPLLWFTGAFRAMGRRGYYRQRQGW